MLPSQGIHRARSRPVTRRWAIGAGGCALTVLLATCQIDKLTNNPPNVAALSVTPVHVLDTAAAGSAAMRVESLTVSSTGAGALTWSASVADGGAWLDITPKSGPTPARVQVRLDPNGLAPGAYHGTVVVSAGQAVGSPARIPVDFVVAGSAPPPNAPTGLAQFQSDGSTALDVGGTATSRSVVFKATVSAPAGGAALRLEVEVEPIGTAFSGTASGSGPAAASGGTASATVGGLVDNVSYHWQARTVDESGGASAWVSFGGNAESDPDFRVALAGTQLVFTMQPSNAVAGAAIAPAVQVTTQDPQGNTITSFTGDVTIALYTNSHGGTLSGRTTVPAVAGVATFNDLSIDKAGSGYTLQATSASLSTPSTAFTISPAAAAKLAFTVQPSATQAGATITPAVRVIARDAFGNTATGFTGNVTLAIATNPSGGTLSGTIPVAAAAGVASFNDLSIDTPGTGYTLTATSGTLTQATSNAFNITAGPPPPATHLAFGVQPSNTQVGVAITPAVTVTALDASGNTVPSFTGAISLALGNAGGATLSGNGPVNAVNGVATFANLTIDKVGTGYTLTATSGTLTQATSNSFNITAAPPPTGDLTVTAATTGQSLPSSYTVTVDGGQSRIIGANGGSTTYTGLSATDHTVALTDVPANCTASGGNSKTVTVPAGGTGHADFTISCVTPTGDLTVTTATTGPSAPSSYTVTVDGGQSRTIAANNGSTTYNGLSATDHTVALTDVPANCTASGGNSKTVTVPSGGTGHADFTITCSAPNQPPTAAFTSSCSGLTCSFTDQSTDPDGSVIGWSWNFGDGATSNSRNPSHPYGATGDYTVTLTVTDDAGASSAPVTHTVSPRAPNQPPTAAFTSSCSGLTCSFTDQSTDPDGSVTNWQWNFGDGQTSNTRNPSHAYSTGGTYNVTLTVTDNQGATDQVTNPASPSAPNQPPSVTAGGEQTVLVGALFTLDGASFSDPDHDAPWTVTIDWGDGTSTTFPTSNEGSINGNHSYPITIMPADYTLRVTVTDSHNASGSAQKPVHVVVGL